MSRWRACNVLQVEKEIRHLWHFSVSGRKVQLQKYQSCLPSEPLPAKLTTKDWRTIVQPRLDVAWFPTEHVLLRVLQLPKAELDETRSMVELQLEKLSTLPVAQVVWNFDVLPSSDPAMQTVVVIIVARAYVEEFLRQLEAQGYLPDRLDVSFLDQLRLAEPSSDGVWIYPAVVGRPSSCLVAWWHSGTLRMLSLVHLPESDHRHKVFQSQLAQMAWSAELEGWLEGEPTYHLVGDEAAVRDWQMLFDEGQTVVVETPPTAEELAASTARRAVQADGLASLLPADYAAKYRQQVIDRAWMQTLGGAIAVYMLIVAAYIGWVEIAHWQYETVQDQIRALAPAYTNTLQLKERVEVLQEQIDLQYAALDCWKAVAENLPPELTLKSLNFDRGRKLTLFGYGPAGDVSKVQDFNEALRKVTIKGRPLFSKVDPPSVVPAPGSGQVNWNFACELNRTDNP